MKMEGKEESTSFPKVICEDNGAFMPWDYKEISDEKKA